MKRVASILFALIVLLSSGLVQFVVHVCPEDGTSISASNCETHSRKGIHTCCEVRKALTTENDCCTDTYVFAVSPKFGGIGELHMQLPVTGVIEINRYPDLPNPMSQPGVHNDPMYPPDGPLSDGRAILSAVCRLTI